MASKSVPKNASTLLLGVALLFVAEPVLADDPVAAATDPNPQDAIRLPVRVASRPLTLPKLVFAPSLELEDVHFPNSGSYANLTVMGGLGITDDITVHALVVPLEIASPAMTGFHFGQSTSYAGPSIGATYRFLRGPVEVGGGLSVVLFTQEGISGFFIVPSTTVRIHVSDRLRIDAGANIGIRRATRTVTSISYGTVVSPSSSINNIRAQLPISGVFNVTDEFSLGIGSGFSIADVSAPKTTASVPLSTFVGWTLSDSKGPVLDIEPYLSFPYAFWSGPTGPTAFGEYEFGLHLNTFFYL